MFKIKFSTLILVSLLFFLWGCRLTIGNYGKEKVAHGFKSTVRLDLEPSDYKGLDKILVLLYPLTLWDNIQVSIVPSTQFSFSADIYSDSDVTIQSLLYQAKHHFILQHQKLVIPLNQGIEGGCFMQYHNSVVEEVQGTCIKNLTLELPATSTFTVVLKKSFQDQQHFHIQEGKVIQKACVGEDIEELLSELKKEKLCFYQLEMLKFYINTREGKIFYVKEVAQLLDTIQHVSLDVSKMVSGKMIDPENYQELKKHFLYPTDWENSVPYLSR